MRSNLHPLCDAVQYNCNIADAQHASNYTLCVYLLKMREYYRWEKGYSYQQQLAKEDVGNWVVARENLWESLEQSQFMPIEIDAQEIDPFDSEQINELLIPKGFVYSGGIGSRCAPHFFLGRLAELQQQDDFTILVSADECARDLMSPPAMTQGKTIFVRKESLRRWIWERVQEWQWNKSSGAMSRALQHYDLANLDEALDQLLDSELRYVIAHELGEAKATRLLGTDWREMLASLQRSKTELMVRAVKDLYADSLTTLPMILEQSALASLHFHTANLTAMRKEIYPSFNHYYQQYIENNDLNPLADLIEKSRGHWHKLSQRILELYHNNKTDQIDALIAEHHL